MNKSDGQINKPVSTSSLAPSPREDQNSDEANDSIRGPTVSDRENLVALSEDSKDTPIESDKYYEDA